MGDPPNWWYKETAVQLKRIADALERMEEDNGD